LRASMTLARLWQQRSRARRRATVAAVFDKYTDGFSTPDLADAAALLKAVA
jgi:hypothetical protein